MPGTREKSELRKLGARLKEFRKKNDMSVKALADEIGVSDGTIANLEKRKAKRLQGSTHKLLVKFLGKNGAPAPKRPTRRPATPPATAGLPSLQEVEKALGVDTSSSATTTARLSAQDAITALESSEEGRAILAKMQGIEDVAQRCRDCDATFTIQAEHVQWYRKKGLFLPNRCSKCLDKRKRKRKTSEIDDALNLDTTSSATPPLKLSFGRMNITIEVD